MVDKQPNLTGDDGLRKVEAQLQHFIEESGKQMDKFEKKQVGFESKMVEMTDTTRRIEDTLIKISNQTLEPSSSVRSHVGGVHGGTMVEGAQSLMGGNLRNTHLSLSPQVSLSHRGTNVITPLHYEQLPARSTPLPEAGSQTLNLAATVFRPTNSSYSMSTQPFIMLTSSYPTTTQPFLSISNRYSMSIEPYYHYVFLLKFLFSTTYIPIGPATNFPCSFWTISTQ